MIELDWGRSPLRETYERLRTQAPQQSCDLVPHLLTEAEEAGSHRMDLSSVMAGARSAVLCVAQVPCQSVDFPDGRFSVGQFFFFRDEDGPGLTVLDPLGQVLGSSRGEEIDVEFGRTWDPFVSDRTSTGYSSVFAGFQEIPDFNQTLHRIVATKDGTTQRGHAVVRAIFTGDEIVIKAASLKPRGRSATNPMRMYFHY